MTPYETVQELLAQLARAGDNVRPAQAPLWVRDELLDAWRAAQTETRVAYAHWTEDRGAESYTVYRAAQDRADAAQDALARWAATYRVASPSVAAVA
jgi:hypothetical protein